MPRGRDPSPLQRVLNGIRQHVDAIETAISGDDGIVPEAKLRFLGPQGFSRVSIHDDQTPAGGDVQIVEPGSLPSGDLQMALVIHRTRTGDEVAVRHADVAPPGRTVIIGQFGQSDPSERRARGRVQNQAIPGLCDVDTVRRDHEVGPSSVCAGYVHLVVECTQRRVLVGLVVVDTEGAHIRDIAFPQQPARVHVASTKAVDALDEEPASHDLFRRAVPVAGQHVRIAGAAKPEQAERQFHKLVVGLDGIPHVSILVTPVGRASKSTRPGDQETSVSGLYAGIREATRLHPPRKSGPISTGSHFKRHHSPVWPGACVDAGDGCRVEAGGIPDNDEGGQVGGRFVRGGVPLKHGNPLSGDTSDPQSAAKVANLAGVGQNGNHAERRPGLDCLGQAIIFPSVDEAIALGHTGLVQKLSGEPSAGRDLKQEGMEPVRDGFPHPVSPPQRMLRKGLQGRGR